ncbi:MAG: PhzF family phenazine biosynthesis protein [Planctomycetota bacterium]|nr:PhzF family phenazine biosynthesis protein [Planctomycetota bacterium]
MQLPLYQVDAFVTARPFSGNPAAVCPLDHWLDDATLQGLALENNLSETAFFVGSDGHYDLRWFTPTTEVDLCGHATLAAGFVVTSALEPGREQVKFETRSGTLKVSLKEDGLLLDLPAQPGTPRDTPDALIQGLGITPQEVLAAPYTVCVLKDEEEVRNVVPNHEALLEVDRAVAVTAPGVTCDFVSRFFGRGYGVDEDPVTGSLHSILVPYWAQQLNRDNLRAEQLSARGGALGCHLRGDRVELTGIARLYLQGQVSL